MSVFICFQKFDFFVKTIRSFIGLVFLLGTLTQTAGAQNIPNLPKPGEMVSLSPKFEPAILKGLSLHAENPLGFGFIVDKGEVLASDQTFKQEADKLIKYFLSALTIPEDKSWVNLSPHEADRIIPDLLAQTQMGKQMLEQDYLLKQLSASLTSPDEELGKKFWDEVYKRSFERYGKTEVPIKTFNKIWIIPQKAVVLQKDNHVFISESRLKVMMAEEYETSEKKLINSGKVINPSSAFLAGTADSSNRDISKLSTEVFRELILPVIEKEVNEGKSFAPVRQIYNSVILATWYKISLKETLLTKIYADKGKIKGVDIPQNDVKQKVYEQYLEAFRKGVYSIIREDYDAVSQETVPRKYFSGGLTTASSGILEVRFLSDGPANDSNFLDETPGRLVVVDGSFLESGYTRLSEAKKAALNLGSDFAEFFDPLKSPNKEEYFYSDGKITVAYEEKVDATHIIFEPPEGHLVALRVPGDISKALVSPLFKTAQEVRQWLDRNTRSGRKFSYTNSAIFNTVLAKALLLIDQKIDYRNNAQINNILAFMAAFSGLGEIKTLMGAMDKATPAERQSLLDKALSGFLAANPDFILNAAQLLGVKPASPQLTIEKPVNGGTVIAFYNPQQDMSVLIVREGTKQTAYLVDGKMDSVFEVLNLSWTLAELNAFLLEVVSRKVEGSGRESQSGYVLNGNYLGTALSLERNIPVKDFSLTAVSAVNDFVALVETDAPKPAGHTAPAETPLARKQSFLQRILPRFFSSMVNKKESSLWSQFKSFLVRYLVPDFVLELVDRQDSVKETEIERWDGTIRIKYDPRSNKTVFKIFLKSYADLDIQKREGAAGFEEPYLQQRYVFTGDLSDLNWDSFGAYQVFRLIAISKRNGFSDQTRIDLLNVLRDVERLDANQFKFDGTLGYEVLEIAQRLNYKGLDIAKMYRSQMKTPDTRSPYLYGNIAKAHFINEFLTKVLETEEIVEKVSLNQASIRQEDQNEAASLDVPGGHIKIMSRRKGLLQIDLFPAQSGRTGQQMAFPRKRTSYYFPLAGVNPRSLVQAIKSNDTAFAAMNAKQFESMVELASNPDFSIWEKGFVFQALLAAYQISPKQLENVKKILMTNTDNLSVLAANLISSEEREKLEAQVIKNKQYIRDNLPKIARALRVNVMSIKVVDGELTIFYNPFNDKSEVIVTDNFRKDDPVTRQYLFEGDLRDDQLNSSLGIAELEAKVRQAAGDIVVAEKPDGKISMFYRPFSNQSHFIIDSKDLNGNIGRKEYLFIGDWRNFSVESYRSVREIDVQMAYVYNRNFFDVIEQQNLLRIVNAVRSIPLSEFQGDNSPRINQIFGLKIGQTKFIRHSQHYKPEEFQGLASRERQAAFVKILAEHLSADPDFMQPVASLLGVKLLERKVSQPQTASSPSDDVGGIDFDPAFLNLQIKRDGRGVALPLPQQNLEQINIEGFYPVIHTIRPFLMQDLPFVFTQNSLESQSDLAANN